MSLSLFDLSDYSGNRRSYWKGIKKGSAGEKQPNNNPGPEPSWSRSSYSWRWAILFWSLQAVTSTYQVCIYYWWAQGAAAFFQAPGGEQTFGFPMQMSTRSECKALMKMVFLRVYLSLCLQGAILLRWSGCRSGSFCIPTSNTFVCNFVT